jgi:hypothetical protein
LPIPATPVLVLSGALAARGEMSIALLLEEFRVEESSLAILSGE